MSSRVAAFVTTVGRSTFEACMRSIDGQCHVEVIGRVAPFAAAQNLMRERCTTELFVQVDEDMILAPDAIAKLVALIDAQPMTCVMATAPLWDVDLETVIYGVKIYRHALVPPFENHVLGDKHDRARWAALGLTTAAAAPTRENCVGEHGTFYTPEEAFERWRGLWQRHRRCGALQWIEAWMPKLQDRATRSRVDLFAWLGAVCGATEESWPDDAGPDFSRPNPVLERLLARIP